MALSADEKFIYVNPDTTVGELNTAQFFPVKYLRGVDCATSAAISLYFRGPKDAISTKVTVSITDGFVKQSFINLADELNFGENVVITLVDRSTASSVSTGGTDFQYVNAYVVPVIISDATGGAHGFADLQVDDNLDIGGDTSKLNSSFITLLITAFIFRIVNLDLSLFLLVSSSNNNILLMLEYLIFS